MTYPPTPNESKEIRVSVDCFDFHYLWCRVGHFVNHYNPRSSMFYFPEDPNTEGTFTSIAGALWKAITGPPPSPPPPPLSPTPSHLMLVCFKLPLLRLCYSNNSSPWMTQLAQALGLTDVQSWGWATGRSIWGGLTGPRGKSVRCALWPSWDSHSFGVTSLVSFETTSIAADK